MGVASPVGPPFLPAPDRPLSPVAARERPDPAALLRPRYAGVLLLVVLALVGVGVNGVAGTVALWPLTAVAVAGALLVRIRWIVPPVLAVALVAIPWLGAVEAAAAGVAALAGMAVAVPTLRRDGALLLIDHLPALLRAATIAVLGVPLAAATAGWLVLLAAGRERDPAGWVAWAVADSMACVLVVLPLLLWCSPSRSGPRRGRRTEIGLAVVAAVLVAVGSAVVLMVGGVPSGYLVLLPVVWIAMRWQTRGVVLSVLLVTVVTGAATASGLGYLARPGELPLIALGRYWLLVTILTLGGAFIAVVTRQRDRATAALATENAALAQRAEERHRMLDTLMSNLPGVAYRCADDAAYTTMVVSGGAADLYGISLDDIRDGRMSLADPIHPDDLPAVRQEVDVAVAAGRPYLLEYRIRRTDGDTRWVWEQGRAVGTTEAGVAILEGFIYDVTERVRSERLLVDEARVLDAAMVAGPGPDVLAALAESVARHASGVQVAVVAIDPAGQVGAERLAGGATGGWWPRTGAPPGPWEPALAGTPVDLPGTVVVPVAASDGRVLALVGLHGTGGPQSQEVLAATHLARVAGAALSHVEVQRRLRHEALHDALTGLPNRSALETRIAALLTAAPRARIGLLFLDVSGFRVVNETYGHPVGDTVLAGLATRTAAALPGDADLFRFAGDQFVVVAREDDPEAMTGLARLVQRVASGPYRVGQQAVHLTVTIGIAVARPDTVAAADLVTAAASACDAARELGRDAVRLYDAGLRERSRALLHTESGLRRALGTDEIETWYQPEYDLATGALIGAEALVRWRTPDGRLVPPDEFIPVAESAGLMGPLGLRVLADACTQAAAWPTAPGAEPMVAVNVATSQLLDPVFPASVADVLGYSGLAPARLCLEITETALAEADIALTALLRLRALGARLAIDDFGTGYSSLSRLKGFPVDFLKIDRSFVSGIGVDPDDTAIVDAVCALARALRLDTIAEGVESARQVSELRARGVRFAQGYLWSRPVPADQLTAMLATPRHGGLRPPVGPRGGVSAP